MGLFDKMFGKSAKEDKAPPDEFLREIARIVSNDDSEVMSEMEDCLAFPANYFEKNAGRYAERGIETSDVMDTVLWIGLVDILIKANYVCERDHSDDKDNFVHFMSNLNGMKESKVFEQVYWLGERDGITKWCELLDIRLKPESMCIMAFDIDSDSYVMFPCKDRDADKLRELAEKAGHRIDKARKM